MELSNARRIEATLGGYGHSSHVLTAKQILLSGVFKS